VEVIDMKVKIEKEVEVDITAEEFVDYEECRTSGVTNMFDVRNVETYTGLSRQKIFAIMKHYEELRKEFITEAV
jgi:hypothetical protein